MVGQTELAIWAFANHRSRLLRYAQRLLGEQSQAEDVVQEAFLRIAAPGRALQIDEPVSYLYRIVHNLALDRHRRASRERRHFIPWDEAAPPLAANSPPTPEVELAAREELRLLATALEELPERTRRALELHRFGGLKLRAIAQELGISIGLAHALVADGLEFCRSRLYRAR